MGRNRTREKSDDVLARAIRRTPEIDQAISDGSRPADPPAAVQTEALGDLTYVPRDIRRIAMLAVVMFVLLGIVAVVLR